MRNRGFSILEVLIAIVILAIALSAIIPVFANYLRINTVSEMRTQAVELAQQRLETLRLRDPARLPTGGADTSDHVQDGRTFTVKTLYCLDASVCNATTRHVTVRVERGGKELYEVETVFTKLR